MRNDGKALEQFVKKVEESLLPSGFKVEANDLVYNEDGIQIAEFDVHIEGNIGSIAFNGLIECRNRPSVGRCGVGWIEQLVGRKDRFNFDKVIAVSTTGFVDEAVRYAAEKGIILRTVESFDELDNDFSVKNISFPEIKDTILPGGKLITQYKAVWNDGDQTLPYIYSPEIKKYIPIEHYISAKVLKQNKDDSNSISGIYVEEGKIKLKSGIHKYVASSIEFPYQIDISEMAYGVVAINKYNEDGKCIGNECTFRIIDSDGEQHSATLNEYYKADEKFDVILNFSETYKKKFPFQTMKITKSKVED